MGKKSFEIVQGWNYKADIEGLLGAYKNVTKKHNF